MTELNTSISLDSLLDTQLDDLADLPEFLPFPPGLHQCTLNFTEKKIGTHPAVSVKLTAIETIELADPAGTPLTKGATTDVSYMLDNVYGQGALKKIAQALQASFTDARTLGQVIKAAEGCTANVITKQRPNKDKTVMYTDIVELQVW